MSRSCNQYRKLLTAFVDGEVSQPEGREIDIHIGRCPGCRAFAETLWKQREELMEALGGLAAGAPPWPAGAESGSPSSLVVVIKAEAFVGDRTTFNHAPCAVGQRVQTPFGAQADVHLADGSFLHLESQSHIVIEAMDGERRVTLREGNLETDIAPGAEPFHVETPSGDIRMASGKYRVEVSASGVAQIEVHAGSVRFVNKFGETPVYREGTVTVMHREKPPRPSVMAPRAGNGDRRTTRGIPEAEIPTPRTPKKPKPFVSQYARARSSGSPASWMVWILVLLLAGGGLYFAGGAMLDRMDEWGQPAVAPVVWPVTDFVVASEDYSLRERALQMRSLLRYLLWGLTSDDEEAPVGRRIDLTADQTGLEITDTPANQERALVYLLSRFAGDGSVDLAALEDETLYTVVFPVMERPARNALDLHNQEAHVRKVADLLAASLDLTVREELQPNFPPHVAAPPGAGGRIAVTARGYLLRQVPDLMNRIPWNPLYRDYGEIYSTNNAAYDYNLLEARGAAVLPDCSPAVALATSVEQLRAATPCLQAASPALNRLRAALGKKLDYRMPPVAAALTDVQSAPRPMATPPLSLFRLLVVDALADAAIHEPSAALSVLSDLMDAAAEFRAVPGSLEMVHFADELDVLAARGFEALLNLEASQREDDENGAASAVAEDILRILRRQQTSHAEPNLQTAYRLEAYGNTPYDIEIAPIAEPVLVLETWAETSGRLVGLLSEGASFRDGTGQFPARIESVTFTASDEFRLDPFTRGANFGYVRDATGARAWSVGPDEIDQRGRIAYDPSNGVLSAGDVVYHWRSPGSPASD